MTHKIALLLPVGKAAKAAAMDAVVEVAVAAEAQGQIAARCNHSHGPRVKTLLPEVLRVEAEAEVAVAVADP